MSKQNKIQVGDLVCGIELTKGTSSFAYLVDSINFNIVPGTCMKKIDSGTIGVVVKIEPGFIYVHLNTGIFKFVNNHLQKVDLKNDQQIQGW